ncbi:MAG: Gfo/Idh/MocA family oxidoreductase, partial [Bryobacteraceae bacterium]|nr:Gfo/Idh/MocA family oxidoreductase [Bryobacteraceae bacterium]
MRIGVLGLGFMGTTHLRSWRSVPGAEVVAVCSENPAKLSGDLSSVSGNLGTGGEVFDFSSMGRFTNPLDLIDDPKVDAVDICL